MKKFFAILALMLAFCVNTTEAAIPKSEMSLGGVRTGVNISQVYKTYGKPARKETKTAYMWGGNMQFVTYYFGNGSFYVTEVKGGNKNFGVLITATTSNNGIKTPAGIAVGDSATKLKTKYGNPDSVENTSEGTLYIYSAIQTKRFDTMDELQIVIKNGKIIKITLEDGILST